MKKETVKEIRSHLAKELKKYEGEPIRFDLPLGQIVFNIEEDGSKRFATELMDVLKKIDFANISFRNFYCQGVDFTGLKGVVIEPLNVFKQSLEYSILNGVTFKDTLDFVGINIRGANFTGAKERYEPYIGINFNCVKDRDITDCVLKGVQAVGRPLEGVKIRCTDFAGSKDVLINPQDIYNKDMKYTKLSCVEFIGPFDGVTIKGANFAGSNGAVINPSMVGNSDLSNTILRNTTISGSFDECNLKGADFTGAKIKISMNPQLLFGKSLEGCKLSGVEFIGSFDNCNLKGADFTESVGAIIDNPNTCEIDEHTNLNGAIVYSKETEEKQKEKIKSIISKTIRSKIEK